MCGVAVRCAATRAQESGTAAAASAATPMIVISMCDERETWVAIVGVRYRDLFRMAAKPRATWKTPEAMKR